MELEIESAEEVLTTRDAFLALHAEMKGFKRRLSRWILTCFLGQTIVLAFLEYYFITHFRR
jgi:hypothetical protein